MLRTGGFCDPARLLFSSSALQTMRVTHKVVDQLSSGGLSCFVSSFQPINSWSSLSKTECLMYQGVLVGKACNFIPDITLMSYMLFFGTYTCSMTLKKFKTSPFFPTTVSPWHAELDNETQQVYRKQMCFVSLCVKCLSMQTLFTLN